jgi:hypothetical protein
MKYEIFLFNYLIQESSTVQFMISIRRERRY